MTMQLAKILDVGTGYYHIVYDDKKKINPFSVYLVNGKGRHLIEHYANYGSCLWLVNEKIKESKSFHLEKIDLHN